MRAVLPFRAHRPHCVRKLTRRPFPPTHWEVFLRKCSRNFWDSRHYGEGISTGAGGVERCHWVEDSRNVRCTSQRSKSEIPAIQIGDTLGIAAADMSSFQRTGGLGDKGIRDWVVEFEAVVRESLSAAANAHGESDVRMGSGVLRNLRKSGRRIGRG